MILLTESEEVIRLLPMRHVLSDRIFKKTQKNGNEKMAYEVIMVYQLHMPTYFEGHLLNIPNIRIYRYFCIQPLMMLLLRTPA